MAETTVMPEEIEPENPKPETDVPEKTVVVKPVEPIETVMVPKIDPASATENLKKAKEDETAVLESLARQQKVRADAEKAAEQKE